MKRNNLLIIICLLILTACNKPVWEVVDGKFRSVDTLSKLKEISDFNFTVLGENEGVALSSERFRRMSEFTGNNDTAFVLGTGDYLNSSKEDEFLKYVKENNWWKTRFFPNISTYENEYFGKKYSDWNSGKELINSLKFPVYSETEFYNNGADYYVQIKEAFYTIHLFQLHNHEKEGINSDKTALFKWLEEKVGSIQKTDRDFIIICGRGLNESFKESMHIDNLKKLQAKADLIISDDFNPFKVEYSENGAVTMNCSSINNNSKYTPAGFVQVYHLTEPSAFVILNLNVDDDELRLPPDGNAYIKYINGNTEPLSLRTPEPQEIPERVICEIKDNISKEDMQVIAEKLYAGVGDCDKAWVNVESGLDRGEVKYSDLWDVFPRNGEIYIIQLTYNQIRMTFGKNMPLDNRGDCKIAIGDYFGNYLIKTFDISEDRVEKTGKREIKLLETYLKATQRPIRS